MFPLAVNPIVGAQVDAASNEYVPVLRVIGTVAIE